jgi:2-oxoisovalerate dehydrogenase E1 component alpha subunit
MAGVTVDGADAIDVYIKAREAVERARRGDGPTLFEAKVNRLTPHSSDDDDRFYRSREEVESYRERDPILVTGQRLRDLGALTDEQEQDIRNRVKAAINDATDFAEAAPGPDPEEAFMHVYAAEGTRV